MEKLSVQLSGHKKKILAISGSMKEKSTNKIILNSIVAYYANELEIEIYNIGELPHFNPDIDVAPLPQKIQEFRNKIALADGVLLCTPEYIFSIPSILKNAIEWNVSTMLFSNKPMAFIVASASGEKAFESLELILKTVETKVANDSKLLIKGVKGIINEKGEITNTKVVNNLRKVINSLINTIEEA